MSADRANRAFDLQALLPGPYYCLECAGRLCSAVSREPGVLESVCDEAGGTLDVVYDPSQTSEQALADRVRLLGLEVIGAVEHATYRVTGLD